jgi:hypothetical protein
MQPSSRSPAAAPAAACSRLLLPPACSLLPGIVLAEHPPAAGRKPVRLLNQPKLRQLPSAVPSVTGSGAAPAAAAAPHASRRPQQPRRQQQGQQQQQQQQGDQQGDQQPAGAPAAAANGAPLQQAMGVAPAAAATPWADLFAGPGPEDPCCLTRLPAPPPPPPIDGLKAAEGSQEQQLQQLQQQAARDPAGGGGRKRPAAALGPGPAAPSSHPQPLGQQGSAQPPTAAAGQGPPQQSTTKRRKGGPARAAGPAKAAACGPEQAPLLPLPHPPPSPSQTYTTPTIDNPMCEANKRWCISRQIPTLLGIPSLPYHAEVTVTMDGRTVAAGHLLTFYHPDTASAVRGLHNVPEVAAAGAWQLLLSCFSREPRGALAAHLRSRPGAGGGQAGQTHLGQREGRAGWAAAAGAAGRGGPLLLGHVGMPDADEVAQEMDAAAAQEQGRQVRGQWLAGRGVLLLLAASCISTSIEYNCAC